MICRISARFFLYSTSKLRNLHILRSMNIADFACVSGPVQLRTTTLAATAWHQYPLSTKHVIILNWSGTNPESQVFRPDVRSRTDFLSSVLMARDNEGTRRRRGGQSNGGNNPPSSGTARAAAPAEAGGDAAPQQPSLRQVLKELVIRSILMYAMYNYFIKPRTQPQQTDATPSVDGTETVAQPTNPLAALLGTESGPVPKYYKLTLISAWPSKTPFDMRVYSTLSPDMSFPDALQKGDEHLIWSVDNMDLSQSPHNYVSKNVTLQVPPVVWEKNTTWYAHVFIATGNLFNASPESVTDEMIEKNILHTRHSFVTWLKKDLKKEGKSLLAGEEESDDAADEPPTKSEKSAEADSKDDENDNNRAQVRYEQTYKPTLPIMLVQPAGSLKLSQLPESVAKSFRVSPEARLYYPPLEINEFWMLKDSLPPLNDTVPEIRVEMSFDPASVHKWTLYKQFDMTWERQIRLGVMKPEQADDFKRIFIDTNPILLATTTIVSLAHSILEALVFKNEISHWKNIKSMEGVSVRSMMWNIVMQTIIFLYLWDNETSWMITVGSGLGIALEIWKLGKAVKFENFGKRKLLGFIPWFEISDRESYSKETKEYDDMAMKYLEYLVYPLVIGYALYSLKYERHKSWYSWIINSLVGAVYAFGFIMMFPQIFINYKLRSVAHMPMKSMMYKTLNTIIDDLFSFIIKMPWLHRLACFRDDVVFLIILYQRWIYPVDKSRVNEFGQQFEKSGEEQVDKGRTETDTTSKKSDGADDESQAASESTNEVLASKDAAEKKND